MYNYYYCEECETAFVTVGKKNEHSAPVCCGKAMTALVPNGGENAPTERHIPLITSDGQSVTVYVGAQDHPMTLRHHIGWIAVAQQDQLLIKHLDYISAPAARFNISPLDGKITAYAFCNQHGLWESKEG
jgi:superoxide reductase